ncbi:MAG: chemotaxis protein CheD [Magnetococcus sp. DMHC-6]
MKNSQEERLPKKILDPGQFYMGHHSMLVSTILGSCVSIILLHKKSNFVTMCHALLPKCPFDFHQHQKTKQQQCFRYVDSAIHSMLAIFREKSIQYTDIEVKLFGGADMYATTPTTVTIGEQNIAVAKHIIKEQKLNMVSEDVGGAEGRVIHLKTDSGKVFLKRIKNNTFS